MVPSSRSLGRVAVAAALVFATTRAAAQQPEPPVAPPAIDEAKLAEAKQLFLQGNELRKTGDFERALSYYLKSRALVRSVPNTLNAAICLDQIGRYDEALELYEELLTEMRAELTAEDTAAIGQSMTQLRGRVGSVDVQADAAGASLVIDGRPRGTLPLLAPVRVLPGDHVVLVMKEGFRTFETSVTVAVGATARVEARLEALAVAGRMRVDDAALTGAEVFVDGARVGEVPWQGTLEPGEHYYFLRRGDEGSAPAPVVIVKGQTALASTALEPLGPELRVLLTPPTAELRLGDVTLGKGRWQGRLPIGKHELEAREEGYVDARQTLEVAAGMAGQVDLALVVDADHPRWAAGDTGSGFVEAMGAFAFGPGFASGAEGSCGSDDITCSSDPFALGFLAGARGGYEFPFHLAIEIAAGYVRATKTVGRSHDTVFPPGTPIRYDLEDALRIHGPYALLGLGYRYPIDDIFELRAHALFGALFTFARDSISGEVTASGVTAPTKLDSAPANVNGVDLAILPELHVGARFGGLGVSVGVAAAIFVLKGPVNPDPGLRADGVVSPAICSGSTQPPQCAAALARIDGERAYGPFVLVLPGVNVGYLF